jgi:GNAT superfamily N-acetyltransferase
MTVRRKAVALSNPAEIRAELQRFAEQYATEQRTEAGPAYGANAARFVADSLISESNKQLLAIHRTSSGSIAGLVTVEALPWDSEIYRIRMGRIGWILAIGEPKRRKQIKDLLAKAAVTESAPKGYVHLVARVPAADHESIHSLEARGFRTMDVQVTLARPIPPPEEPEPTVPGVLTIAPLAPGEIEDLKRLSIDAYLQSRLFVDTRLPRALTKRLYDLWIENDCRGRAASVFVARQNHQPVGYVACLLHPAQPAYGIEKHGDIDLIAVRPDARGRGIALLLVQTALAWCRDHAQRVIVKTQITNHAAIRLYERSGFSLEQAHTTLHCWL